MISVTLRSSGNSIFQIAHLCGERSRLTRVFSSSENRPAYALWKEIIDKEMHKTEDPDIVSCPVVDRDLRGHAQLYILAAPDNPGIYISGCLSLAVLAQAGLHRKLGHKDHAFEGISETHILHKGLKVYKTVLD